MRKRVEGVLIGAAAAFLLAAGVAGAQPANGDTGPGRGQRGFDRPARYLGLTDQQKAAFQQIREKQRPQFEALHKKMRDNMAQLRQALESQNPDPTSVGELAIEGHRLRGQVKALRDDADKQMRALLTPEQQVKFDAMRALHGERGPMGDGPGWHGKGGPSGPPDAPPPPQD
jgi:Spy/CpxP family protein refolding chaperone